MIYVFNIVFCLVLIKNLVNVRCFLNFSGNIKIQTASNSLISLQSKIRKLKIVISGKTFAPEEIEILNWFFDYVSIMAFRCQKMIFVEELLELGLALIRNIFDTMSFHDSL